MMLALLDAVFLDRINGLSRKRPHLEVVRFCRVRWSGNVSGARTRHVQVRAWSVHPGELDVRGRLDFSRFDPRPETAPL
jgi:hypothetical protein